MSDPKITVIPVGDQSNWKESLNSVIAGISKLRSRIWMERGSMESESKSMEIRIRDPIEIATDSVKVTVDRGEETSIRRNRDFRIDRGRGTEDRGQGTEDPIEGILRHEAVDENYRDRRLNILAAEQDPDRDRGEEEEDGKMTRKRDDLRRKRRPHALRIHDRGREVVQTDLRLIIRVIPIYRRMRSMAISNEIHARRSRLIRDRPLRRH